MWLIELVFTQFCKSDMSKYGDLEVFQSPLEFEITRVDCIIFLLWQIMTDKYTIGYAINVYTFVLVFELIELLTGFCHQARDFCSENVIVAGMLTRILANIFESISEEMRIGHLHLHTHYELSLGKHAYITLTPLDPTFI